jgi:hypothetical protein
VDHGPLDHPLEAGGGLGVLAIVDHEGLELVVDIVGQSGLEDSEVNVAGLHHPHGVLILDERQEQVLQGCVFVLSLIGESDGPVQGLFELARE